MLDAYAGTIDDDGETPEAALKEVVSYYERLAAAALSGSIPCAC